MPIKGVFNFKMNFHDLSKMITLKEGQKHNLSIAQVKEVLACLYKLEGLVYLESDKASHYLNCPTDVIRDLALKHYHDLKLKETVMYNKKKESKKAQPKAKPAKKGSKKKAK
jgi:hypothetical protein